MRFGDAAVQRLPGLYDVHPLSICGSLLRKDHLLWGQQAVDTDTILSSPHWKDLDYTAPKCTTLLLTESLLREGVTINKICDHDLQNFKVLWLKLDGVAPLITDPPPTCTTIL